MAGIDPFGPFFPMLSSDAARLAASGGAAALIAGFANWRDRRRTRRSNLDAVSLVPWTTIYMATMLAALVLLGLAARAWFNPA